MLSGMICKTFNEREKRKKTNEPLLYFLAGKWYGDSRHGARVYEQHFVCRKGC